MLLSSIIESIESIAIRLISAASTSNIIRIWAVRALKQRTIGKNPKKSDETRDAFNIFHCFPLSGLNRFDKLQQTF